MVIGNNSSNVGKSTLIIIKNFTVVNLIRILGIKINEPVALYQHHYQEQALTFYKNAIGCYKKLSAVEFSRELKVVCQHLFEKAADCC